MLRALLVATMVWLLTGCGGGGGGAASTPMEGSVESRAIASRVNGNTYPLNVYLPPASAGPRANLPIVYALDSEWWFETIVGLVEAAHARVIVVGIGNNANRAVDYVPQNTCTPFGGGNVAFFQFIRTELIPYVEANVGGDPARRALLGHSHGGSFVYYALLSEASTAHTFSAYLASDSSLGCMPATGDAWDDAYAAANSAMPVRLHMSHTSVNTADIAFDARLRGHGYTGLVATEQAYSGTHTGIIPAAFADALRFAFAP